MIILIVFSFALCLVVLLGRVVFCVALFACYVYVLVGLICWVLRLLLVDVVCVFCYFNGYGLFVVGWLVLLCWVFVFGLFIWCFGGVAYLLWVLLIFIRVWWIACLGWLFVVDIAGLFGCCWWVCFCFILGCLVYVCLGCWVCVSVID